MSLRKLRGVKYTMASAPLGSAHVVRVGIDYRYGKSMRIVTEKRRKKLVVRNISGGYPIPSVKTDVDSWMLDTAMLRKYWQKAFRKRRIHPVAYAEYLRMLSSLFPEEFIRGISLPPVQTVTLDSRFVWDPNLKSKPFRMVIKCDTITNSEDNP